MSDFLATESQQDELTNRYQRKQTNLLIGLSGQPIALIRKGPPVDDEEGGKAPVAAPRQLPSVRRYFSAIRHDDVFIINQKGSDTQTDYVLIGRYDDDIILGDIFILNRTKFEVVELHPDRRYQVKARVVARL